jgi:hemerythrin
MRICEWTEEYSVGIADLDDHHHRLFEILNNLFTLMAEGAEDKPIIRVLEELIDYTHYHFEEEEKVMAKMSYPELAPHKILHQQLIAQLKEFYEQAQHGMAIFVATKVANIGLEWLKSHILLADHKYADYMRQQGLQY